MTITANHKELFRQSTTAEKLALFQSLLDSHEIQPNEALALLGSIHAGLRQPREGQDGTVYARYARLMEALFCQMPEIYQHVVVSWRIPERESLPSDDEVFVPESAGAVEGTRHVHEVARQTVKEEESVGGMESDAEETGEGGEEAEAEEEPEEGEEEKEEEGEEKAEEESESEEDEKEEREGEEEEEKEVEETEKEEEEDESGEEESEAEKEESEEEEESETEAGEESEKETENESEAEEESEESETQETEESEVESREASSERESAEESDAMATEAAEAAEHMEEMEIKYVPIEEETGYSEDAIDAGE